MPCGANAPALCALAAEPASASSAYPSSTAAHRPLRPPSPAPQVTSGASSDLQQVSNMARQMVINYGMSDIGPWSLLDPSAQSGDMIMRMMARNRCEPAPARAQALRPSSRRARLHAFRCMLGCPPRCWHASLRTFV